MIAAAGGELGRGRLSLLLMSTNGAELSRAILLRC